MNDEAAFLRAIVNAPEDDAPRLIFADWLEERDDPRATFVRLEVEFHRLEDHDKQGNTKLADRMLELAFSFDLRWVERMRQSRTLLPGARLDLAVVADGQGLIDVRGGDGATALLVEGQPVALNWNDNEGSVGQYLVFTGHTRGSHHARQLDEFVSGEGVAGQPLAEQLGPLLATFTSGTYWLKYTPSAAVKDFAVYGYPALSGSERELIQYYPAEECNLVGTQARESLDEGRVTFFSGQIRASRRPIVLTVAAEGAWCEFIIDGHHKLEAYSRLRVKPTILSIVRWDAPPVGLGEGIDFLPAMHPGIAAWRRSWGATAW